MSVWFRIPWVPEVFLARVTIKTWQKPETELEKSLAPRVGFGKTVSNYLKWWKCKMTWDEYLMAWNKYCGKLYLIIKQKKKQK